MRLLLILIATALIAAPTGAIAASAAGSSPSAAQTQAKKPKPGKKTSKKKKRAKKKSRAAARNASRSTSLDEREAKGPILALSPITVGTLTCAVPASVSTAAFAVGDLVEITCDLINGTWTLRKVHREDDVATGAPGAPTGDEVEVKGTLVSLSPLRVGSTTCAVPAGVTLTGFAVGDFVEVTCDLVGGVWTLRKLKHEDDNDDNGDGHHSGSGSSGDDDDDDDDDRSGHGGDDDDDDDDRSGHGGDDD